MSEAFGSERRLTRREEFRRVYAAGTAYPTPWFVCYVFEREDRAGPSRLGITASRQTGGAHDRNRYKRWAREVFRRTPLRGGVDIVVRFRPTVASVDFERFRSALLAVLSKARLCEI